MRPNGVVTLSGPFNVLCYSTKLPKCGTMKHLNNLQFHRVLLNFDVMRDKLYDGLRNNLCYLVV